MQNVDTTCFTIMVSIVVYHKLSIPYGQISEFHEVDHLKKSSRKMNSVKKAEGGPIECRP